MCPCGCGKTVSQCRCHANDPSPTSGAPGRAACGCALTPEDVYAWVDARGGSCDAPADALAPQQAHLVTSGHLADLRAHLAECPSCRQQVASEEHLRVEVARACACEAPDTLAVQVRRRLSVTRIEWTS